MRLNIILTTIFISPQCTNVWRFAALKKPMLFSLINYFLHKLLLDKSTEKESDEKYEKLGETERDILNCIEMEH